jgi:GDSL-like Lipase/Acylhydrolase family/N-terminus of Esterase_SGNH_hydro-type
MNPRLLALVAAVLSFSALAAETKKSPPAKPAPQPAAPMDWHDVKKWGVEGRAWTDMERQRWFDRFPTAADGKVTAAVWNLSRDSAGMMFRFKTDATSISARYVLRNDRIAMPHMPATGVSGVDLYARDDQGRWRWVNVTRPEKKDVTQSFGTNLAPGFREYAAYLPLYNGIESLEIGVGKGAKFEGLPPRSTKPIVFYGTSITHGACASRPGMVHTAIIGRRLDLPVVNLGFSGNGRMDAAVGELLGKIDAAAYVIDCLPNMGPADVRKKCPVLVKMLRAARPATPIVLVEDRRNTNSWIIPSRYALHTENHAALRESYEALKKEGVTNLHYLPGDDLLGDDSEGATDGSHPNDLGFMRQAAAFEPILRAALGR